MNTRTNPIALGLLCLGLLFSCKQEPKDDTPWVSLFDGESFNGWTQLGGEANYTIRDNSVVGTTVSDTPNSFMTTDKMYGDFILELDYLVDSTMNSGIQIRSNSYPHYMDGRVHGYQIEIDPSDRAWSAGIYDEARRGWLNPMTSNPEAQKAFKQNDWNHYRIEAIGDTIKTWINDVPAAHLIDDKTSQGFIALQVHSIYGDNTEGTEIIWKNIKILTDSLSKYSRSTPIQPIITKNALGVDEAKKGWKMLWDGETTNGWRGARLDEFPEQGWEINDGVLTVLSSGGAESAAGGDIVTKELYGDFELMVDFKITEGANSGIKYYVDTDINKGPGSSIGLEYQILDDERHPDAKLGNHDGSRTISSLYDLIQADPNKHVNPIGEWNTAHIISKDGHVEHWLNGMKVLEYERGSEAYKKLVSESKYVQWPNFGESEKGHILLQDHGDKVSFKNIKIKPITKD
ncbi:3-keto-disaccharide hydrolase [Maribacter sp. CXY002]|uniref:3-keto-disaccharide hydrolase n=1 Tax=Maribacter luteocoastalis TaxID=3407671 RepID=UPI003B685A48